MLHKITSLRRAAAVVLLLALIGGLSFAGQTAQAAGPAPCARLNAALNPDQVRLAVAWLRRQFPGGDFTVDYSCSVDPKHALLAIADYAGLQSAVYALSFDDGRSQGKSIVDGAVESPVVLTLPGGQRSLFFAQQAPDGDLLLRSYRIVGLEGGTPETLYEAHYDPQQRGCAYAAGKGAKRVLIAAAVRFADVNKDGTPDIVIDREQEDCASGKSERSELTFLATPQGWRPRR